jgi:hypothetical protein
MFYPETANFQTLVLTLESYQALSYRCCQGPPS